ncbi:MAG: hypothetical protein LBQ55_07900, partial [Treponema sp.]|nr:hypothetical protein [Treponema sp.]
LEAAGKAGDRNTIREILPDFYRRLSELAEAILVESEKGEVIVESEKGEGRSERGKLPASHSSLPAPHASSLLTILKTALEAKDMKEIDRILEELEGMGGADGEAIQAISDRVLLGEYQEALALVDKLLERGP